MPATPVAAADAVKLFKNVKVQEARKVQVTDKEGKVGEAFETKMVDLAAEHVLSAYDNGAGTTIVTIDGRRHQADGRVKAAKAAD